MSEDLFRLCVIRPPLQADPRYPPISLAQESRFQVGLGNAVSHDPTDARKGLEDTSNAFISSADFIGLDATDDNNAKLEKAAQAVDALIGVDASAAGAGGGTAPPGSNHSRLVDALRQAFNVTDLTALSTVLDPLESRMKDSVVALRLLSFEQTTGTLLALTRRLRTIEIVRKVSGDPSFYIDEDDLQKYDMRPLLVPTFVELQSILSTATARAAAAAAQATALAASQARIDGLFKNRFRLMAGLNDLVQLPSAHRIFITPKVFAPAPAPIDMTHFTLANQHLQLANNLAKLTLTSFEKGIGRTVLNPGVLEPHQPVTHVGASPAATAPATIDTSASSLSTIAGPLVDMSKTILSALSQVPTQPQQTPSFTTQALHPFALLPTAPLAETTKSILNEMKVDITKKPIDGTVKAVAQQLSANSDQLDAEYAPYNSPVSKVQYLGGLKIQHRRTAVSVWADAFRNGLELPPRLLSPSLLFPWPAGRVTILGIADLLVVKQQLVGYEGGDVAYVENILKGETQSHEVDNTTSMQTEVTNEEETTDTKENDTTTAERFEVSNESDQTIKQDEAVKAGVTVSASYGPTVSISANASYSNDRSQSDSTKAASRYSKDITTKATEKIAKRVLQRTITRTSTETAVKDIHSFANTAPNAGHISGVYQWLNKVYEAQMWNYGKRTMLDFLIPEPGAFYLDKQTDPGETANTLMSVPPFTADPSTLDGKSAVRFGVQYGVTDLDPPPPEMSRASAAYAAGKDEPQAKADKITIPPGFQVSGVSATASGVAQLDKSQNWVIGSFQWGWDPSKEVIGYVTVETDYLGGLWSDSSTKPIVGQGTLSSVGVAGVNELKQEQSEIAWSVTAAYMDSFAVTIEVFLERTDEAMTGWQNKTWGKLRAASDKIIADQQAALDKAKYNSAFQGRNPDKNKTIVRDEMKKSCISIMTDSHFDELGANNIVEQSQTRAQPGNLVMSEMNIDAASARGPFVQFFEEAFEWDEMTWMLFPYFWGRKDHWYTRVDYEDDDPDFEKFVQAGFARANVPIRPGFEGALEHFLATGKVWMGGPLPGLSSSTFLPLALEIQESLGKKADQPTKYGDPWLVKVPTNLVRLRHDDQTPVWIKDKVSGDWTEVKDLP